MSARYTVSEHAVRRFRQRFGHVDATIEELLANSIVYGGQRGSDYLLLNEQYQLVFPVTENKQEAEHFVKTVLTLPQAKANLARFHHVSFELENAEEIRKRCEELRAKAKEAAAKAAAETPPPAVQPFKHLIDRTPPDTAQIAKCKEQAARFVEKTGGWHFPDKNEAKQLYKELKAEIAITRNQFDDVFLPEVGRLIREKRQQLGVRT